MSRTGLTATSASAHDDPVERDFTELLRLAKCGDPDALREFHSRYEQLVLTRVHRLLAPALRRRCDTSDIVQSVFEDVLRELPAFEDRGEEAFKHWLCQMAENKVHDRWRRQLNPSGGQRESPLETADGENVASRSPGPATQAGANDDCARLQEALARLPELQREIVKLHDKDGLPYKTVAERLGLPSADAARMQHSRALNTLRKDLGEQ